MSLREGFFKIISLATANSRLLMKLTAVAILLVPIAATDVVLPAAAIAVAVNMVVFNQLLTGVFSGVALTGRLVQPAFDFLARVSSNPWREDYLPDIPLASESADVRFDILSSTARAVFIQLPWEGVKSLAKYAMNSMVGGNRFDDGMFIMGSPGIFEIRIGAEAPPDASAARPRNNLKKFLLSGIVGLQAVRKILWYFTVNDVQKLVDESIDLMRSAAGGIWSSWGKILSLNALVVLVAFFSLKFSFKRAANGIVKVKVLDPATGREIVGSEYREEDMNRSITDFLDGTQELCIGAPCLAPPTTTN